MKQNDDKREFLIIDTPCQLTKLNFKDLHICEVSSSKQHIILVSFLIKKWIPKHKLIIFQRQDIIMWEA